MEAKCTVEGEGLKRGTETGGEAAELTLNEWNYCLKVVFNITCDLECIKKNHLAGSHSSEFGF